MSIVRDDVMSGEPRLEGRRITVRHVVSAVADFGGVEEAAAQLRIPVTEVREAIEYAESNPEEIDKYRDKFRGLAEDAGGESATAR